MNTWQRDKDTPNGISCIEYLSWLKYGRLKQTSVYSIKVPVPSQILFFTKGEFPMNCQSSISSQSAHILNGGWNLLNVDSVWNKGGPNQFCNWGWGAIICTQLPHLIWVLITNKTDLKWFGNSSLAILCTLKLFLGLDTFLDVKWSKTCLAHTSYPW